MQEMVFVGDNEMMGEVIGIDEQYTTIQVYESTTGLKPGEPVRPSGSLLSATLGPGILKNIFDGIERPLKELMETEGAFIAAGTTVSPLDEEKLWDVTMQVKLHDRLRPGQIYATCPETELIEHRCMLSPMLPEGEVIFVAENGQFHINDEIVRIRDDQGEEHALTLTQKWPIRNPRPVGYRKPITRPLITGQRVIDTLFPIAKGGAAAIPGGFQLGKTMTQHQLAKWCDADIIVYVGCGERGNEMTQVLEEFTDLIDPKSNKPLLARTVLIANTSNMPVAAREASIYTGITLAEYYRDMGYHVAIMADSTSRWAEALREIFRTSGRNAGGRRLPGVSAVAAIVLSLQSHWISNRVRGCQKRSERILEHRFYELTHVSNARHSITWLDRRSVRILRLIRTVRLFRFGHTRLRRGQVFRLSGKAGDSQ